MACKTLLLGRQGRALLMLIDTFAIRNATGSKNYIDRAIFRTTPWVPLGWLQGFHHPLGRLPAQMRKSAFEGLKLRNGRPRIRYSTLLVRLAFSEGRMVGPLLATIGLDG
jgi:hypothetical protein